jgi:Pentapeptide repeats (8 copies)
VRAGFQFSRGEWSVANTLHDEGRGEQYAILVVRRGKIGGVPISMDLLADPKRLVEENLLKLDADGYQVSYSDADLSDSDLTEANLSSADLRGADLEGADLEGAILEDTIR